MKNDKWLDLTNGVCWSIIFSLAAIIMSIVALADTHPRVLYSADGKTVVLGFDYIGVIVGILTLLVTLLVAWNIWQVLDSRRKIQEIESSVKSNELFINARVNYTQGVFLMTGCIGSNDIRVLPNLCVAYRNFFESLYYYLQSTKDASAIKNCVENMEKCLNKLNKHGIEFQDKTQNRCDEIYETILLMQFLTSSKLAERLNNLNKQRTSN